MSFEEDILIELKQINKKLNKLDGMDSTLKKVQQDISKINLHIEKGIYVDMDRLKERMTLIEQKIV